MTLAAPSTELIVCTCLSVLILTYQHLSLWTIVPTPEIRAGCGISVFPCLFPSPFLPSRSLLVKITISEVSPILSPRTA